MKKTLYVLTCALCTLLVLPAAAQVPAYVPTDGLVGWWPFNGNANDESGNGNDGVVNGATLAEDRLGNANAAYGFDGINDFISIQDAASLSLNGDFTISAWKLEDPSSSNGYHSIVTKRLVGDWSYNLAVSKIPGGSNEEEDKLITGRRNNGGAQTQYRFSNAGTQDNVWQHILVVVQNDTLKFYLDGADAGYINGYNGTDGYVPQGNTFSISMQNQLVGLTIGDCNCNNNEEMQGSLDDIAIYNRALTEQEIQNLYTGTTPPPCVSLPSNLQQGLVGYWPFCGNANDESGNGNDGVVNGATLTEDRFGNENAAYSFTEDYILIPSSDDFNSNNSTISVWAKTLNAQRQCAVIRLTYEDASNEHLGIVLNDLNPFGVEVAAKYNNPNCLAGQGWQKNEVVENILDSEYHHVVGTIEGDIISIYIDGQLRNQLSAPNFQSESCWGGDIQIGRNWSGFIDYFSGSLDDIGIWNRALTPEEVQELYTLDACTFTVYDTLTVYETVYDTLYTYETIYDTVTTYVTVTDTLLIDITFIGFEGQPSWLNTVTVFPNPASDHITIDYGNFALMAGYNTIITNAAGATVYSSAVNSQQVEIDINAWGATGVYYMSIYDASGALVAVRHIVLE